MTREERIEAAARAVIASEFCRTAHGDPMVEAEPFAEMIAALASPPLAAEPRRDEIATTLAAIVSHYRNGYEPALFVSVIAGFIDVAEVVLRERPAPPLAAEGTATPRATCGHPLRLDCRWCGAPYALAAPSPAPREATAATARFVVDLVTWDAEGANLRPWDAKPDHPGNGLRWETIARMALDVLRAASPAPAQRDARARCSGCGGIIYHPEPLLCSDCAASPSPSGNPGKEPR
jgi:hypothetical protein